MWKRKKMWAAVPVVLAAWLLGSSAVAAAEPERFRHDAADVTIKAAMLDGANHYEASVASRDGELWMAWLEFVPGKGDLVHVARAGEKPHVASAPGQYVAPTLTLDSKGALWLTWEAFAEGHWDVFACRRSDDGSFSDPQRVSTGPGPDISHRVAADAEGGVWVVWQSDRGGQFDIVARRITSETMREPFIVSRFDASLLSTTRPAPIPEASDAPNDWRPDVTVSGDGTVYVVWDAYDGRSFNVYARACRHGEWTSDLVEVTLSTVFEGRARVAPAPGGRAWVAWEEGEENWGRPYMARRLNGKLVDTWLADAHGPVHRFRRVRFGVLDAGAGQLLPLHPSDAEPGLPMPAFEVMHKRTGVREGVKDVGTFYERPEIAADAQQRLWIFYRHYYGPYIGVEPHHHIEPAWGVYARCLTATGWSPLQRMSIDQRDGMQRLHITAHKDGIAAVWTTGRTDRRPDAMPRGVAHATVTDAGAGPARIATQPGLSAPLPALLHYRRPAKPDAQNGAGASFRPVFGDLHRHTDLSLCYVPIEGTIDDAYRYAIDVAQLDFLGITDHTHDLVMGDPLSQVWWRSIKEVTRHELRPNFFPIFSYERSRPDTDHNVFSLRSDMLRPHTYPLPDFWKELDGDTFTIAHQPVNRKTWDSQDNAHRPLIEVYQGFRSQSILPEAHEGLGRGYLLGFIASSDHISTSASYAGVWTQERSRESIFRALQARRTFGATDKIVILLDSEQAMQGSVVQAAAFPPLRLRVAGTASIDRVEVVLDGRVVEELPGGDRQLERTYLPPDVPAGLHYLYMHVHQSDGNEGWSSPLWIQVDKP